LDAVFGAGSQSATEHAISGSVTIPSRQAGRLIPGVGQHVDLVRAVGWPREDCGRTIEGVAGEEEVLKAYGE